MRSSFQRPEPPVREPPGNPSPARSASSSSDLAAESESRKLEILPEISDCGPGRRARVVDRGRELRLPARKQGNDRRDLGAGEPRVVQPGALVVEGARDLGERRAHFVLDAPDNDALPERVCDRAVGTLLDFAPPPVVPHAVRELGGGRRVELREVGIETRLERPFAKEGETEGVDRRDFAAVELAEGLLRAFTPGMGGVRRNPLERPAEADLHFAGSLLRESECRDASEREGRRGLDGAVEEDLDQDVGLAGPRRGLDEHGPARLANDPPAGFRVGGQRLRGAGAHSRSSSAASIRTPGSASSAFAA